MSMAIFNSYVKLPEGTYVYLIFPSAAKILNGVKVYQPKFSQDTLKKQFAVCR